MLLFIYQATMKNGGEQEWTDKHEQGGIKTCDSNNGQNSEQVKRKKSCWMSWLLYHLLHDKGTSLLGWRDGDYV